MGSTLKIFNAALVYENNSQLQKKKFTIDSGYQITSEKLIKDEHIKKNNLNFDEVFTKSSNVGSIKILESIGIEKQDLFRKLGINDEISLYGLNVKIDCLKTGIHKLQNSLVTDMVYQFHQ